MFKKTTTIISILFTCFVLIGMPQYAHAQEIIIEEYTTEIETEDAFLVNILFKADPEVCSIVTVEVIIPAGFNADNPRLNPDAPNKPFLDNLYEDIDGNTVLTIGFDNPINGVQELTITGIKAPKVVCETETHTIEAKLKRCTEAPIDAEPLDVDVLALEEYITVSAGESNASSFATRETPFRYLFFVTSARNNYETTSFNFQYNNSALKCIGVTVVRKSSRYNEANTEFPFSDNQGTNVTFSTKVFGDHGANPDHIPGYYIYVYFDIVDDQCSPSTINFTPSVTVTSKASPCVDIDESKTFDPVSLTCLSDNEIVAVPDIDPRNWSTPCVGEECIQSSFSCQINNSFRLDKTNTNGRLDYVLELEDEEIDIQSLNIELNNYYPLDPGDIEVYYTLCASPGIETQFTGVVERDNRIYKESQAPSAYPAFGLTATDRIAKVRISYPNIPKYESAVIWFNYLILNTNCAGNSVSPKSTYGFRSSVFANGSSVPLKDRTIVVYPSFGSECEPISIIKDYIKGSINSPDYYVRSDIDLFVNSEYDMQTEFYIRRPGTGVENVSYTYTLQENMSFDLSSPMEFAYHNSGFTTLENLQTSQNDMEYATFTLSPDERTMTISGLKFTEHPCGSYSYKFYVRFKVKTNPYGISGVYRNSTTKVDNERLSNWSIQGFTAAEALQEVLCSKGSVFQNAKLAVEDEFSYNFILNNQGNQPLDQVVIIGLLPSVNDVEILNTGTGRNSSFNVIPSVTATGVERDRNGNITTENPNPIQMNVEYHVKTSTTCIGDLFECTTPAVWTITPPVTNSPVYIRLTPKVIITPPEYSYVLTPFSKFYVNVSCTMPATGTLGAKAFNSFAAIATRPNGLQTLPIESLNTSITIAESPTLSCEDPPSCVTSFVPIQGEDYLVSAWVHQDNREGAVIFDGASIVLDFQGTGDVAGPFKPSGVIIDGWQRIEGTFTVPGDALIVLINLKSYSRDGSAVYFDDIRIQPLKSSLKSFVYDPISLRLMAELDENNYATFYEYDEEGALIRVKKETERGVKTIQETGNNTRKR